MNTDHKELVAFQLQRTFNIVARGLLTMLEDIKFEHDNNFDKLVGALPNQEHLVEQADYLDEAAFSRYRKKILDVVGEARRELLAEMDKYTVGLNYEK